MSVTLRADQCPAIPMPRDFPTIQGASNTTATGMLTSPGIVTGQTMLSPAFNAGTVSHDLLARYGGGMYAIGEGLQLVAPGSGLTLTVRSGHAVIDGIVEIPTDTTVAVPQVDGRAWIWLTRSGALNVVSGGSLTAPSGAVCLLGSVVVSGSDITPGSEDTSGVIHLRSGIPFRRTADAGEPADTPPAETLLITETAVGLYFWVRSRYIAFGAEGAPGSQWRHGSGTPDNSVGVDGDLYLRDSTGEVYQRVSGAYVDVMSLVGPAGANGAAGAAGPAGAGFILRGAWASGTAYAVNDVVTYGSGSYAAIMASTGVAPDSDGTKWQLMAGPPGGTGYFSGIRTWNGDAGELHTVTVSNGLVVSWPVVALPAAPVVTAAGGVAQVSLSWPAIVGATGYTIYRSTSAGSEGSTPYNSLTGTSYTDTGLTNGTTYYYEVTASNVAGEGPRSAEVSATPLAAPDPPTSPSVSLG